MEPEEDQAAGADAPPQAGGGDKPEPAEVEPKPAAATDQAGGGLLEAASTVAIFAMFVYCWYGCPKMPGYVAPDGPAAGAASDITGHAAALGGLVT